MNSRKRLIEVLNGNIPDCVPVAPDTSNMIPARLTGKPFWDLYLYNDPPIWKAYIDCVKYFGFDSLLDGYVPIRFEELGEIDYEWTEAIIFEDDSRKIVQKYKKCNGKYFWDNKVDVYYIADPPTMGLDLKKLGISKEPASFTNVKNKRILPEGEDLLALAKKELGNHGLVGVFCGTAALLGNPEDIYAYYDDPGYFREKRDILMEGYRKRFEKLMSLDDKPDFICTGASGTLVFQTPEIFIDLGLPIVKMIAQMCKEREIYSHVHSCGPEKELVRLISEETDITVIDPLEVPPMGDCNLAELKGLYGDRIVLKGNLHTTDVMLFGSKKDVIDASKKAIDDAAKGGKFILSTGDQCGRDTPDENIFAMIETARSYGKY